MNKIVIILTLITFLFGCSQQPASSNASKKQSDSSAVKPQPDSLKKNSVKSFDHSYDNTAKYMAGVLQQTADSKFKAMEEKGLWKTYKSSFDSSWNTIERTRLTPMKAWAAKELTEANSNNKDLFYPFGGPDFLNAFTLFPHAKKYTLIGLEPVGGVPDLTTMNDKALNSYLYSVHNALGDIFKRSYFITRKMVHDMHNNQISGTVPLLYVFLARTHNTIVNVKRVGINDNGVLEEYTVDSRNQPLKKVSPGIRIDFIPEGQQDVRSLYYFSLNLLDAALVNTPGIMKYIASLGSTNTYIKSASYLMHYLTFNNIRNAVLKQSEALLQDDSGIAYRFFDKKVWDFKFYGRYTRPVNDFNWVYENDLKEVYRTDTSIKPVPFILGYHWDSNGINLLRAVRKKGVNSVTKTDSSKIKK
jgi:hypothetical protein